MITIKNLTKTYNRDRVLDNVSFEIKGGEFVSIVGASGAGKSTLIHALIGSITATKGSIQVDQYEVTSLRPAKVQEYRRRVGIVFQDYKLLPKKTVFENIAFALEVAGYSDQFVQKRTTEVIKLVGLEKHRNHFPRQLSGGEKQRTAIARALVHAPELLIADEPTGNLDPDNAEALAKLLLKINQHGTTVIIASHNKEIVSSFRKRVITLDEGKLISDKKNATYK